MAIEYTDSVGFDSQALDKAFWNANTQELIIQFQHGNRIGYEFVDRDTWLDLAEIETLGGSAGRFYNTAIKGHYSSFDVDFFDELVLVNDETSHAAKSNALASAANVAESVKAVQDSDRALSLTREDSDHVHLNMPGRAIDINWNDDGLQRFRVKYTTEHEVEIRGDDAEAVKAAIENTYKGTVTEVTWLL